MAIKLTQRSGWCKHRTAFSKEFKTCKVGVDFHAFGNVPLDDMPCIGRTTDARAKCEKFENWTPEEIAAREAEINARYERIGVIRRAIIDTKQRSGKIPCPCCKTGTVGFSVAASNGHVHAKCSTGNCAAWME